MSNLINPKDSLLLIIDIQEKLAPEILDGDKAITVTEKLLTASAQLDIPHLVTEQYPKGLGTTIETIKPLIKPNSVLEKITFSAAGSTAFIEQVGSLNKKQMIVCGMETHVCVLQTVLSLVKQGYEIFVVEEGVGSRSAKNKSLGIERMRSSGATIVSCEMVLFEWLQQAGTEAFKALLPLIK